MRLVQDQRRSAALVGVLYQPLIQRDQHLRLGSLRAAQVQVVAIISKNCSTVTAN